MVVGSTNAYQLRATRYQPVKGLDFTQCHSSFPSSTWWGHAAIVLVSIDLRGHPLDFQPGQAVMVGEHGQPERRPYSIAWVGEMKVET